MIISPSTRDLSSRYRWQSGRRWPAQELKDRALAMEANAETTQIKGLGRTWSWASLLATDDMFQDEFVATIDQSCGCYDG